MYSFLLDMYISQLSNVIPLSIQIV